MAAPAPSSLFPCLTNVWRDLSLRSDIDGIILEILGKLSLEKIYADQGDRAAYQHLLIELLAQLNAIFYIQRLTIPSENVHVGQFLGFLVSWEVTVRCIELVLQAVNDGREYLWECDKLRDKYLADFLLSALRILTLHPRPAVNHRARRERFARIHKALEQVFDSYPGEKSFLLLVAKDVTNQLCIDPNAIQLPQKLKHELPNLNNEMYPLNECLSPPCIGGVVAQEATSKSWLYEILTLRDISHFIVGASIQYAANQEVRNVGLQSASARSRNAVLRALENIHLPTQLLKTDLFNSFASIFRTILPDTMAFVSREDSGFDLEELEFDALESLGTRLTERQIVHRVSDGEVMQGISKVMREIVVQDNPGGHFGTSRPALFILDCPDCHLVGGAQLRAHDVHVPLDLDGHSVRLPEASTCPTCGEEVALARDIALAGRTWNVFRSLETNSETINIERHLPSQFQLSPPKVEPDDLLSPISARPHHEKFMLPDPTPSERSHEGSQVLLSPQSQNFAQLDHLNSNQGRLRSDSSTYVDSTERGHPQELAFARTTPAKYTSQKEDVLEKAQRRQSETAASKPKTRWRIPFSSTRQKASAPTPASGDSSSLSSGPHDYQRLEEIPLASLTHGSKSKGKAGRAIHTSLSQNSPLALFWSQMSIQVWDLGSSPPTVVRGISTDSTCILASVAKTHVAYIIGTRDQKLTLRILNLSQPSSSVVEYRMPSSPWCRSIAIDCNENYVAVGFEASVVRFFKIAGAERPRQEHLHLSLHDDCRRCPAVDSLSFSHDGAALLASTRCLKTGYIQLYLWRLPFITFHELTSCRYHVPLHESEDNGITGAILQSGYEGKDNLICITTWTQSGTPILVQPRGGHQSPIKTDVGKTGKIGNRIQCAAFSQSGEELAMVNDKGHLYQISHMNSSTLDIKRISTSKELTSKSPSFSMGYMGIGDENNIIMLWADAARSMGWVKKIPVAVSCKPKSPPSLGATYDMADFSEIKPIPGVIQTSPAELPAERPVRELDATTDDIGQTNKMTGAHHTVSGFSEYKA